MRTFNKLILTTSLTLAAGAVRAAQLLALGSDGMLHTIDTDMLSVTASMQVAGAKDLRGMDVRPADGMIYAISGATQLYTLDPATGKATPGVELLVALPGSGHAVVDFNPVADRLRLLAADGTNLRANVKTGEVATDGSVAYSADFDEADMMAKVVAGAYTNSYVGTEKTELYTVDLTTGMLMLQNPPNDGIQQPVGELAKGLETAAMDIVSDGMDSNITYVLAGKTLHTIDLKTGTPTPLGNIADLPDGIIDIAVLPAM